MSDQKTTIRAETLFADVTYISEADWVRRISDTCFEQGYIALIDWSEQRSCWVFHTLFEPNGGVSKKIVAEEFERKEIKIDAEQWLKDRLCERMVAKGEWFERQVANAAGIADVVTRLSVIEVKSVLTRDVLFYAAGQVLAYRNAIDPQKLAVILARRLNYDAVDIASSLAASGIRIVIWDGNSNQSSEVIG